MVVVVAVVGIVVADGAETKMRWTSLACEEGHGRVALGYIMAVFGHFLWLLS